jgi:hypothetical protein
MWPGLLIVLGSCIAGVILGFFLYQFIARFLRRPGTNDSEAGAQTPTSLADDLSTPSAPAGDAPRAVQATTEVQAETRAGGPDRAAGDLLQTAPEDMKDDGWLNAGIKEVSSDVLKRQDDDWLNAEVPEPPPAPGRSTRFLPPLVTPDVSVPPVRPEPAAMNLKIEMSPPGPGEAVYETGVASAASQMADDGGADNEFPAFEGTLDDVVDVRRTLEPAGHAGGFVSRGGGLTDVLSAPDSGVQGPGLQALMDTVAIRATGSSAAPSGPLADEVSVRALPGSMGRAGILMDEVAVRPVEGPVATGPVLADGVTVRQGDNLATMVPPLMDAVVTRPSAGPVNADYALLDDLITKGAAYRARTGTPTSGPAGAAFGAPGTLQSPAEQETTRPLTVEEISELFDQRRAMPSAGTTPREQAEVLEQVQAVPFRVRTSEWWGAWRGNWASRWGRWTIRWGRWSARWSELLSEEREELAEVVPPVLSWRSIRGMAIGMVVGVVLGVGYYNAGLYVFPAGKLWTSDVQMQVRYPDFSTYVDPSAIQNTMQYYVLETRSPAFMEFLSQRIAQEQPLYAHTAGELGKMLTLTYNNLSGATVTNYFITVTSSSADETSFLSARIPDVFRDYLVSREANRQQQEMDSTMKAIRTTEAALVDAQRQLAEKAAALASSLEHSPDYVLLKAKVETLKAKLDELTPLMNGALAQQPGATTVNITALVTAVDQTNLALVQAQKELAAVETRFASASSVEGVDYQLTRDYAENLKQQLTTLTEKRAAILSGGDGVPKVDSSFAAGTPTTPARPLALTLTACVLLGGVAGIVVAWFIVNYVLMFGKKRSDTGDADAEED